MADGVSEQEKQAWQDAFTKEAARHPVRVIWQSAEVEGRGVAAIATVETVAEVVRYGARSGTWAEAVAMVSRWINERFDVTKTQNVWAGNG